MLYTILGLAWLVGWMIVKIIAAFYNKADAEEVNKLYKEFKPNKKDFQ